MDTFRAATIVYCVIASGLCVEADDKIDTSAPSLRAGSKAMPIERAAPGYPRRQERNGQEGWVIISYVVNPDGSVADPIVEGSSGILDFEKAALKAVMKWRFQPATWNGNPIEQCHTKTQLTFAMEDLRSQRGASRKFIRFVRSFESNIDDGEIKRAEELLAEAFEEPRWNLYETTRLWIASAQLHEARGESDEELASLCRAAEGRRWIRPKVAAQVLRAKLILEVNLERYSDALDTYALLQNESIPISEGDPVVPVMQQILEVVQGDGLIISEGSMKALGEGEGIWSYHLLRRKFAFDEISGEIDKVEIRCEWHRGSDTVTSEKVWDVPESWGDCWIYAYGDEESTFKLIEYPAPLDS